MLAAMFLLGLGPAFAFSLHAAPAAIAPRRHGLFATMDLPSPRILTEENARAVLDECMTDLGTLFGSNAESRKVGITGGIDFVELSGPVVVISLSGRFWHQRSVVVERVSKYMMDRIPECVDVDIVDVAQLDDSDPTDLDNKFAALDAIEDGSSAWPAADAVAPGASSWSEHLDDDSGLPYYYNEETGESVWERPAVLDAPPSAPASSAPAPASFGNDGGMRPDQF